VVRAPSFRPQWLEAIAATTTINGAMRRNC
jgi:hypothetical protein